MAEALILSCWVHFAAAMILFGSSLFPLYAGLAGSGASVRVWQDRDWLARVLSWASVAALVSAVAWLALEAGEMGSGPADALDPTVLSLVLTKTSFGRVWQVHLILCLALVAATCPPHPPGLRRPGLILLLSTVLLASLAWIGHAVMATGTTGVLRITNQTFHLLAAGLWLGGLMPLGRLLGEALKDATAAGAVRAALALRRFSNLALGAVMVLLASGLVNSWFLVGSLQACFGTPYGHVLLLKLTLLLGLLALAAGNRLILLPRLEARTDRAPPLSALRRTVAVEQGLGLAVLGVASVLGTLAPAINGP